MSENIIVANIADVRLVLDMLLNVPTDGTLAKATHNDLVKARRYFIDKGSLGAWDRCVNLARRLQRELAAAEATGRTPETEVEARGRDAVEHAKMEKRRQPKKSNTSFDPRG